MGLSWRIGQWVGLGVWAIPTYWGRDRRSGMGDLIGLNYRPAVWNIVAGGLSRRTVLPRRIEIPPHPPRRDGLLIFRFFNSIGCEWGGGGDSPKLISVYPNPYAYVTLRHHHPKYRKHPIALVDELNTCATSQR